MSIILFQSLREGVLELYQVAETRHNGNQGDLAPFAGAVVVYDRERVVAVQDVIHAEVQCLQVLPLEREVASQVQTDVRRHLVVVHAGEVIKVYGLSVQSHSRVLTRCNSLPMARLPGIQPGQRYRTPLVVNEGV